MPEPRLIDAVLPEFGEPTVQPTIPSGVYRARMVAALEPATARGLDALVVYGDREHAANVAYLSGYDPRFEETLLVALPGRRASLFLGNEGWSYAELPPHEFERALCQTFSLPGQPRGAQKPLAVLLAEAGLAAGMRIGAIGWKPFGADDPGATPEWLDIPAFIADQLKAFGPVINAADILMDLAGRAAHDQRGRPARELRIRRHLLLPGAAQRAVRPQARHDGAAGRPPDGPDRLPHSAHLMLSTGERASRGLPSPSLKAIARGEPFTMACGLQGALNARAGFVVADAAELPEPIRDYVPKLVAPYFAAVAEWYAAVGIGTTGGELDAIIRRQIGDPFFGVGLNPGHYIHIDEWMNSPIFPGSAIPLRSGMAIQVDVIPATHSPWFTTNIEDGIALADAALREEFAARYPEAWDRVSARRAFMREVLGIALKPEVLPFSNIPAYLPPFLLSPGKVLSLK